MGDTFQDMRPETKSDYTKTRVYAWVDLLAKVLSAIALAVLGTVGWLLQSRAEESRQMLETRDRAERKYLPMLRSLSELELVLAQSRSILPFRDLRSPAEADRLEAFGEQLSFIAQSLFLPDGDLDVAVHPPNYDNHVEFRKIPLQAGTLMFAELLRHDDGWRSMKQEFDVQLVPDRRVLRSQGYELLMTAASMAAIQAWVERNSSR